MGIHEGQSQEQDMLCGRGPLAREGDFLLGTPTPTEGQPDHVLGPMAEMTSMSPMDMGHGASLSQGRTKYGVWNVERGLDGQRRCPQPPPWGLFSCLSPALVALRPSGGELELKMHKFI